MNKEHVILQAEKFLRTKNIKFLMPREINIVKDDFVEVVFFVPDAFNPNAVIDPPDVRVWVNIKTGDVTLITQM